MKLTWVTLILGFFIGAIAHAGNVLNTNKTGVALSEYDAVSYFQPTGPLKGNVKFQTSHDGAVYFFANEANKQKFLKTPERFVPQFGGWCAYAVADSKSKVEVDPKSFLIQDGRLLLFYNGFFGNTRKKWQETKGKDAATFLKEADKNWPDLKDKES